MNINPVCNDRKCLNTFKAGYKSRINVKNEVDDYVQSMLDTYNEKIEKQAQEYRRNVKVAQKGDTLLVNSGIVTSNLNLKKMSKANEFYRCIVENIRTNSEIAEKGLKKSFVKLV